MGRPRRVLVVEDEESILECLGELLGQEGYEVLSARNGREAIELLENQHPPSLILLDLMLPIMNGWEFRRWQQKHRFLAHVPVVLLSATTAIHVSAELLGTTEYLRKPLDLDRLLRTVDRLTRRA